MSSGDDVTLMIRPEDIRLSAAKPNASDNVLLGQVRDIIYLGNFLDCRVDVDGQEIRVQIDHDEDQPRGTPVYLTCPLDACRCLAD